MEFNPATSQQYRKTVLWVEISVAPKTRQKNQIALRIFAASTKHSATIPPFGGNKLTTFS